MSTIVPLVRRLEEEATRRWSSIPSHVRQLLNEAANKLAEQEALIVDYELERLMEHGERVLNG